MGLLTTEDWANLKHFYDWIHSRPWTTGGWVGVRKEWMIDRWNWLNFLSFTHSFSDSPNHPGKRSPELTVLIIIIIIEWDTNKTFWIFITLDNIYLWILALLLGEVEEQLVPVLRQASPNVPLCICRLVEASMMTFWLLQLEKMATGKVACDL